MLLNSDVTKDKYRIENTLKDFNVKTENEFQIFIDSTWDKVKCTRCRKEISLLNCCFDNGDPVCNDCGY